MAEEAEALVSIETRVMNETAADAKLSLVTTVVDESGKEVASAKADESIVARPRQDLRAAGGGPAAKPVVDRAASPVHRRQPGVP